MVRYAQLRCLKTPSMILFRYGPIFVQGVLVVGVMQSCAFCAPWQMLSSVVDATQVASDTVRRDECTYTSCYCEENVYKLCERLTEKGKVSIDELHVVFLSNPAKKVPV
jgi:hypothetical protein